MSFWYGKRVFITGHTGFKGSWLSLWLRLAGAEVIGYSLPPVDELNLFEVAHIADCMTSIIGDIRDMGNLENVIRKYKPEIVIHMAAQALVRPSYEDPVGTFSTNVMGTVALLEAARKEKTVRVVINVTSDKCYENKDYKRGYREDDPMGGHDPYSCSKGCAELVTDAYRRSFYEKHGIGLSSVRAGNVIGGGDWSQDRLVPDIMKSIVQKKPVAIRNPHAVRPWQHVLEALGGYLLLTEKMWDSGQKFAEGWNFGPNDESAKPVSWIVDHLCRKYDEGAKWKTDNREHPYEAHFLKLDCRKAKAYLDWTPKLALDEALNWVVEWYRAYQEGQDMKTVTEEQILRYKNWSND
ncbi:CDP-glucose 4,6-dehydratase [Thermodesulfobacteriota bacterium]